MRGITRVVWILSLVSLFADIASEMLYPVMPVYLRSIGFSVLLIGVLEGVAEAVAGISKGYFGKLSDSSGKRLPFVRLGYFLSALSKPLLGMLTHPAWVFGARTTDRMGKGIRTGARDAMLSTEATPQTKGAVFGFHRGMDSFGAVLGPVVALVYLYFAPQHYTPLFFIAFIPGIVSVGLIYLLKEKAKPQPKEGAAGRYNIFAFVAYWKQSPALYRRLVRGLLVFTLFNSSDYFLLLKMSASGVSDTHLIGIYILYNLVYALASFPLGKLGDRVGLKYILVAGLVLFAAVYAGMAFNNNVYVYIALFALYGLYVAATDGISKAWITNISNKQDTATAIGTFAAFQSVGTMIASSLAGLLWYSFGAPVLFISSAVVTLGVCVYLLMMPKTHKEV